MILNLKDDMRLTRCILISALVGLGVLTSYARPIGESEARQLAKQFFSSQAYPLQRMKSLSFNRDELSLVAAPPVGENIKKGNAQLSAVETYSYYVYNRGNNNGFVMIAGDDVLPEVLAYATTGAFSWKGMPEHVAAFMAEYKRALDRYIILQQSPKKLAGKKAVAPILRNISWGQGEPWNAKCPNRYPVGCVATAISQIMRYYQWPERGVGFYTHSENGRTHRVNFDVSYDWKNMPGILPLKQNVYYESYDYTPEQKEALSTFCYHVGVASNMNYGADGSGTRSAYVVRALREHFRYDRSTVRLVTRNTTTQEAWNDLIYSELSQDRPVYYAGIGTGGGHAFICDGYDGNGRFHINWGWNGLSDNYFDLNVLNPDALGTGGGSGGGFSDEQEIIVGIIPDKGTTEKRNTQPTIEQHRWNLSSYSSRLKVNYTYLFLASEPSFDTKFRLVAEPVGGGETIYGSAGSTVTLQHTYKKELSNYIPYLSFDQLGSPKNKSYRVYIEYLFYDQWVRTSHVQGIPCEIYVHFDESGNCTRETVDLDKNLQFVEDSAVPHLNSMVKSSFSFVVRNVGVEEYHHLSLVDAKTGRKLSSMIEPIPVGKDTRLTFVIEKLSYAPDAELQLELQCNDNSTSPRLALGTYKVEKAESAAACVALRYDGSVNAAGQIEVDLKAQKMPELIFHNASSNVLIEKGFAYCVVLMGTIEGETKQYLTEWNRVQQDILVGGELRDAAAWQWRDGVVPQTGIYSVSFIIVDHTLNTPITVTESEVPPVLVKAETTPPVEYYTVATNCEGNGSLLVNGKSSLEHLALGEKVAVKATPASGWVLQSLVLECAGNTEPIANGGTLVVKGNTLVKAVFVPEVGGTCALKVLEAEPVGAGSLLVRDYKDRHILTTEELKTIAPRTRLLLYPQAANDNYLVQKILVDGKEISLRHESIYQGGAAYADITITKDIEVQALFLAKKVQIEKQWNREGGVLQLNDCDAESSVNTFDKGSEIRITATPAVGYRLTSIKVGDEEFLNKELRFVATANVRVEAIFSKETPEAIADDHLTTYGEQNSNAPEVKIYPNPAVDYVFVEGSFGATVYLFDLSGRCVATSRVASSGVAKLDLSAVATGDYILSVAGKVARLMIQK